MSVHDGGGKPESSAGDEKEANGETVGLGATEGPKNGEAEAEWLVTQVPKKGLELGGETGTLACHVGALSLNGTEGIENYSGNRQSKH
jgi:hypothetical protein